MDKKKRKKRDIKYFQALIILFYIGGTLISGVYVYICTIAFPGWLSVIALTTQLYIFMYLSYEYFKCFES